MYRTTRGFTDASFPKLRRFNVIVIDVSYNITCESPIWKTWAAIGVVKYFDSLREDCCPRYVKKTEMINGLHPYTNGHIKCDKSYDDHRRSPMKMVEGRDTTKQQATEKETLISDALV